MNLADTIQPNSDQLDAVDLLSGARTFTITDVKVTNSEQPVEIKLAEFDRPWRPGKSMRRVLVSCWGADGTAYVGRRVRLYCDPTVVFGGSAVGGTRIEALSHIDGPKKVPLLVSRGKSAIFTVQPLKDEPAQTKPNSDSIVRAFAALGVGVEQLEAALERYRKDWTAEDIEKLTHIGKAIKAGETSTEAEFGGAA